MSTMRSPALQGAWDSVHTWRAMPFSIGLSVALSANFLFIAGHNPQRIAEVMELVAVAVLAVLTRSPVLVRLFTGKAGIALAGFFFLGAIGSALAVVPAYAYVEVSVFFLLYLVASLVADEIAHAGPGALIVPLQLVALGCFLHGIHFVSAYYGALTLHIPLAVDDFTSGFSNIRFFNHAQTTLLPLLLLLCCVTPRTLPLRRLWLTIASFWWLAIFATSARGTCVGLVAGLAGAVVLRRRHALPFLRQALSTAAFGALAYVILLVVIPELTGNATLDTIRMTVDRTMSDPTSSRTVLWRCALGLIAQHPWLGVGPMHFAHEAWRICTGAHPHDWVLQIAAEWGLPAFLCLVFVLATGARALVARARTVPCADAPGQAVATALLVALVAILVDGLVSGVIVMPQSQLAIAFYAGCAMGWCRTPALDPEPFSGRIRLGNTAIVLAAAAALLVGAGPGALAFIRDIPLTDAQMAVNHGPHWPRLWHLGYF